MSGPGLRRELLPTFLAELEGEVAQFGVTLEALARSPSGPDELRVLFRIAHTLKGAARVVGIAPIERLCQSLEALLAPVLDGTGGLSDQHRLFLARAAEALQDAGRRLRAGEGLVNAPIVALTARGPK